MEYVCGKCKVPEKYCCPHLDCVADVWHAAQRAERRKTVRSAVQQRKAEIALCHLKGVVCGFQYTSKALHCGSSRRCDKATPAVA